MTEVIPLEPWHIESLRSTNEIDPIIYTASYAAYLMQGEGYTLLIDGMVYACAGMIPQWEGVAEGWSCMTDRARAKPLTLCKAFKGKMDIMCSKYRRVQLTVEEGFGEAELFAKYLGFTFEGRMPYYSPDGKTHLRYARY